MKNVIVFPRGQLSEADRAAIVKAGAVPVEADDPAQVVLVIPTSARVSGDDLFDAMMEAIGGAEYGNDSVRSRVIKNLAARLKRRAERDEQRVTR